MDIFAAISIFMEDLIFATHNENKVKEVAVVLNHRFEIRSLSQLGITTEIEEPYETIKENAIEKARVVEQLTGLNCFAEDTGLEVTALHGEPGVKSARYAGENRDFDANIDKLLSKLHGVKDRSARFITIVCLRRNGEQFIFEGECKGTIIAQRRGSGGFGYDSIFVPEGDAKTFAEMDLDEKNQYSHRRKAIEKLVAFLEKQS